MEKISKKIISMALLLGLILSIFSPVESFAAGDGKITVDNAKNGQTYTLYRVFDLVLSPDAPASDNSTYQYRAVSEELETAIKKDYSQLDSGKTSGGRMIINAEPLTNPNYEVNGVNKYINPYDFSNWLSKQTVNNFKKEGNELIADADNDTKISWSNLPLGYYMVKSTLGTLVALNTTDKEVTIHEKNPNSQVIDLKKEVKGGVKGDGSEHDANTNDGYVKATYANIGEELEYKITFNVHAYANSQYVLEDVLPAGITLNSVESVKVGTELMSTTSPTVDKLYSYSEDGKKQIFTFSEKTIQAIAKSIRGADENNIGNNTSTPNTGVKTVTITYKAKLNNSAKMSNHEAFSDDNVNRNTVTLTYDKHNEPQPLKLEESVDVRTTDFNIFKFEKDTDPNRETGLENAKFKIYTGKDSTEPLKFTKLTNGENYIYDQAGTVTEITTSNSGTFSIKGLKPGIYWIEESAAPTGYNKIQDRMKIVITDDNISSPTKIKYTVTIEGNKSELVDNTVKIENQKGAELPETGGMGRTMIYTAGGVLFFGALVLLIARKRSGQDRA